MASPPLAPYPTHQLRQGLEAGDWDACVQAWILSVDRYLCLSSQDFQTTLGGSQSVPAFLASYMSTNATNRTLTVPGDTQLRRLCLRLAHRTLHLSQVPQSLASFSFLSDFCTVFSKSSILKPTIDSVWDKCRLADSAEMAKHKTLIMGLIPSSFALTPADSTEELLRRIAALLRACPSYGRFLLAGSDVLDALISLWSQGSPDLKRKVSNVVFLSMKNLVDEPKPNVSTLLDHLYDLKFAAEKSSTSVQYLFLRQLVSSTPLLRMLRKRIPQASWSRSEPILKYLVSIEDPEVTRKRHVRKGKQGERTVFGHEAVGNLHMHKMSLISQVQDLFPDLGSRFIARLLDEYQEDVEQVTAHLLDSSLPAHLASLDHSESLSTDSFLNHSHLEPRSTPPLPERKNVFDDDDFDQLALSTRKLHVGKKDRQPSTVNPADKARIYSALAAFDSDDDERDDTYDVEDVGGTVDVHGYDKDIEDAKQDQHTEALFRAWKIDASTFNRDRTARQSSSRQALRTETGMTDEAVEGFALMLHRDPRRLRTLEAKFSTFSGEQQEIQPTKWRGEIDGQSTTEDEGGPHQARSGGRSRGRGRGASGGGSRGRGGNVAGSASEKDIQVARQRKDENKASRANHNRRAQRAKKLARAGFPG